MLARKRAWYWKKAKQIINHVGILSVIYSTKENSIIKGFGNLYKVSDEWFYGKKFNEILNLFGESVLIKNSCWYSLSWLEGTNWKL